MYVTSQSMATGEYYYKRIQEIAEGIVGGNICVTAECWTDIWSGTITMIHSNFIVLTDNGFLLILMHSTHWIFRGKFVG